MRTLDSISDSALPSFDDPPVIETVLGVQFERIVRLRKAHLGAFWLRLGDEWPHVADVRPLSPQYEIFDDPPSWIRRGVQLQLTDDPAARVQIRNRPRDRMIQVQNGRFHYNWLKSPDKGYPRYSEIRPEFDKYLGQFGEFLGEYGIGPIAPDQWEVTYVNHFPKGTVWESPDDWARLLPKLGPAGIEDVGMPLETFGGHWQFEIAPKSGRLHFELTHGHKGNGEGVDLLVAKITARGSVTEDGLSLSQGLDLGRKAIVLAFKELTSADAHEFWGLKE